MSLFICDECGCVENTNCCTIGVGVNEGFPNLRTMEMHGFDEIYEQTGERSVPRLLCSECNTGTWHGQFEKEPATEVEIIMGEQLQGDEKGIFTFHPLWRAYSDNEEDFNVEMLKSISLVPTPETSPRALQESLSNRSFEIKNYHEDDGYFWNNSCDPYVREEPKVGRNDSCPCGSGKKYKKCCINKGNIK